MEIEYDFEDQFKKLNSVIELQMNVAMVLDRAEVIYWNILDGFLKTAVIFNHENFECWLYQSTYDAKEDIETDVQEIFLPEYMYENIYKLVSTEKSYYRS